MSTTNIYVLSLEGGKYYVGKSNNVYSRYQDHLNGDGSAWTKRFRPISLVKILEDVSPFEEDKITKEYMAKYGVDRVRGGSYIQIELDAVQREALTREIRMAKDLCSRCGRAGHFEKDCYARRNLSDEVYEPVKQVTVKIVRGNCHRCGRHGHSYSECYASTSVKKGITWLESDWDSGSDSGSESDSDSGSESDY